jgi:hypothetical protein
MCTPRINCQKIRREIVRVVPNGTAAALSCWHGGSLSQAMENPHASHPILPKLQKMAAVWLPSLCDRPQSGAQPECYGIV